MSIQIQKLGDSGNIVPSTLLGQNLEMISGVDTALLTNHLRNSHFLGPVDTKTGLAPEWSPFPHNNFQGIHYQLLDGAGITGDTAQIIENIRNADGMGIVQSGCSIHKGERLEIIFWARVQNYPVMLKLGIKPLDIWAAEYDSASILVDSSYWKEYRLFLNSDCDDAKSVFYCIVEGTGIVWLDQIHLINADIGIVSKNTVEAFKQLNIPVLRFPGGCITTVYHWQFGIGEQQLRSAKADPVFKWYVPYDYGTDEYLSMCNDLGITPQITINISTGTPEEAGKWAEYCASWYESRGIEPPLMYWQIGNEHYGFWEIGNMTGDMYAELLKEFVPKIRDNYPNARIIAIGVKEGQGRMDGETQPWRVKILDRSAGLFDLLSFQWYDTYYSDDDSRHYQVLKGVHSVRDVIKDIIEDCKIRGLDKKVALTEWNLWNHAAHHDGMNFKERYDVQHGLFCAEVFHMFAHFAPDMELANFYHLINPMGIFYGDGYKIEGTPLLEVFKLYRPAFDGNLTGLSVDPVNESEDSERLSTLCLSQGDVSWLFLINQSIDESMDICLTGFGAFVDGVILKGTNLEADFIKDSYHYRVSDKAINIPPLSIIRLKFS